MGKFEIFKDKSGQWRFRLLAGNNKIIAVSEAYTRKANAIDGVRSVVINCVMGSDIVVI